MDLNGDGEIDFSELLLVQQQYRESQRRKLRHAKEENNVIPVELEPKLPKIPMKDSDPQMRKTRDRVLKARDALLGPKPVNGPLNNNNNSKSNQSRKFPEIPTPNNPSGTKHRLSSFKEALNMERRKLFEGVSNRRISKPPAIEIDEA